MKRSKTTGQEGTPALGKVPVESEKDQRGNARIRLVVDLNRCQGYLQCCFLAPDTFKLLGEEALIYNCEPDPVQREHILRAAAACPVQAILVEELAQQQDGRVS